MIDGYLMQVAQQQQQQMHMQGQHAQQQPQGSMPAVPGSEGRTANSVQLQTLQSPPRCANDLCITPLCIDWLCLLFHHMQS